MYRYEATSLEGFIQQLAVSYLGRGYFFYVTGHIPAPKDPAAVDRKLVGRYDIAISKWARARRKQAGHASMQYLRHGRFFVLLCTHGRHRFFEDEARSIRDARRVPIKYQGYAIGHRGGHVQVRIELGEYRRLKAYFVGLATHRSTEALAAELARLPFEPYAPVRGQFRCILRAINRAREAAGFEPVSNDCFRFHRRIYRPFGSVKEGPVRSGAFRG